MSSAQPQAEAVSLKLLLVFVCIYNYQFSDWVLLIKFTIWAKLSVYWAVWFFKIFLFEVIFHWRSSSFQAFFCWSSLYPAEIESLLRMGNQPIFGRSGKIGWARLTETLKYEITLNALIHMSTTFQPHLSQTFRILANRQIPLEAPLLPGGHMLPGPPYKMGNSDVWAPR
jgi:hypothetical protein